jgi:hypothetical protein
MVQTVAAHGVAEAADLCEAMGLHVVALLTVVENQDAENTHVVLDEVHVITIIVHTLMYLPRFVSR